MNKFNSLYKEIMNEEKSNALEEIKKALKELGVSFEMDEKSIKPFKVIYKPNNKSDEWYEKFEDIVDRYNLSKSVKSEDSEKDEYGFSNKMSRDQQLRTRLG